MKRITLHGYHACRRAALHAAVFVSVMSAFAPGDANAQATIVGPTEYRIVATDDKFKDTWQYAASFKLRAPRQLRASHLELSIGGITTPEETRPFISMGPAWRLPITADRFFLDLKFAPTIIGGSRLNGRDLGGNFHFTSSAAIGATFGRNREFAMALRVQHTSNGGLNSTNPGLDMVGLTFSYNANQQSLRYEEDWRDR